MDGEKASVVVGWVLLALVIVGVWVVARRTRKFLGKLRVSAESRSRSEADATAQSQGIGSLAINVGSSDGGVAAYLDALAEEDRRRILVEAVRHELAGDRPFELDAATVADDGPLPAVSEWATAVVYDNDGAADHDDYDGTVPGERSGMRGAPADGDCRAAGLGYRLHGRADVGPVDAQDVTS